MDATHGVSIRSVPNLRLTGFRASVLLIDLSFPASVEALRSYAGYLVGGAGIVGTETLNLCHAGVNREKSGVPLPDKCGTLITLR